jgi:hypothetical protein
MCWATAVLTQAMKAWGARCAPHHHKHPEKYDSANRQLSAAGTIMAFAHVAIGRIRPTRPIVCPSKGTIRRLAGNNTRDSQKIMKLEETKLQIMNKVCANNLRMINAFQISNMGRMIVSKFDLKKWLITLRLCITAAKRLHCRSMQNKARQDCTAKPRCLGGVSL